MGFQTYNLGDAVEVRDSEKEPWANAVITKLNPVMASYKQADGRPSKSEYQFNMMRKVDGLAGPSNGVDDEILIQSRSHEELNKNPAGDNSFRFTYWKPEDDKFWMAWGRWYAWRNLVICTAALFLCFAIWTMWGMIAGQIIAAHKADPNVYTFGFADKKDHNKAVGLLAPIAGISGGTQRVVHAWCVNPCGGRTAVYGSMLLAFAPMVIAALLLSGPDLGLGSLWVLYGMAIMSGIGGGGFSSIMSNISFLFPDRLQGTALGIVGGLGNLGVSIRAQLVPRFSVIGVCVAGKTGVCNALPIGGKYVYNAFLIWAIPLLFTGLYAFFYCNNLPTHGSVNSKQRSEFIAELRASSDRKRVRCLSWAWGTLKYFAQTDFGIFMRIQGIGYGASVMVALLFIASNSVVAGEPALIIVRAFVFAVAVAAVAMASLFFLSVGEIKNRLQLQLDTGILRDRNTVFMTLLYIMTFGSFIGYANAFPKLIKGVFNENPADYAWLGAFCGSFARVIGGILSDYVRGSLLTQIAMIVQVWSTIITGIIVRVAMSQEDPSGLFTAFVFFVVSLFTATGVGNATTFKQMATLCKDNPEKRGPLLGFTAAIAAYGAFIIPTILDAGIQGGFLDICFFVFAIYYIACSVINWWYYCREKAAFPC